VSIAPTEPASSEEIMTTASAAKRDDDPKPVRPKRRRKSTSHLKEVPETLELREQIKKEAELFAESFDKSKPFLKNELEQYGRQLLKQMDFPEKYLGFSMVLIGNFFWKRQFLAVPFERRLLLLPHCLKHAEGCPAEYDELGLDCETCGACSIADYKVRAEQLGYKVLVAEGSPIVLKIILAGYVDGILGVACLNVLEKAIDKVLIAGVPSYAIPLHSGDCKNTSLDESWVWDVLEKYKPLSEPQTTSYVPLMRAANKLFDKEFESLLPSERTKSPQTSDSPLGKTEAISYDWLAHGGKRLRPFITLAAYDALTGAHGLNAGISSEASFDFPDSVKHAAMAIEAFHKASLVHDDIQDDDQFRYGRETLHKRHGTGIAINVGDYLIGVGYRLVNSIRCDLGSDVSSDVLEKMAAAHVKLCDGQGAEMAWHESEDLNVSPLDALLIYALKTAPAFEAALYAGLRMAGPVKQYEEMIPAFSRHVGVGFQILNDLKDWHEDDNKLVAGQDALAFRPTVLLALALQSATDEQRQEIEQLMGDTARDGRRIGRLRHLFEECNVFESAEALVDKSRARAEALADGVEPDELRHLLYFLVDSILAPLNQPVPVDPEVLVPLTISGTFES
jgi:geranylgeranyl diphosphate synthase type II